MKHSQLPFSLRRLARRYEKKYWKDLGVWKEQKDVGDRENLLHMFNFDETKEGAEFWGACEHFENMEQLRSTQVYKNFIAEKNKKTFHDICFILSLLLYTAFGIFIYKTFVPADLLSKFFIR